MKKNYRLIQLLYILFLCSCKKESNNNTKANPTVNVYVAGYEYNGALGSPSTQMVAKLWKNGTPVNLTDGSHSAGAGSIAISGNDVYIAGGEYNDASIAMAKYWKNGVPVILSDGTINNGAASIAVSGNDVYVAGVEGTTDGDHPMYWKNGQPVYLSYSTFGYAYAYSIAVSDNDVYVAGRDDAGHALYWKNGIPVILAEDATALSISILGNDIYVAGFEDYGLYGHRTAAIWKNGELQNLTDGSNETFGNGVVVSGNNVYVAGSEFKGGHSYAVYWENGTFINLSSNHSVANAIAVSGNDVYVAGCADNGGTGNVATYWKNGKPVNLTDGSREACANSIFIAIQ